MCLGALCLGRRNSCIYLSDKMELACTVLHYFYMKNTNHLLVPIGESHHDVQRGQTEV